MMMVSLTDSPRFTLDPVFLDRYRAQTPPFGFNGLGELVYYRTYSRLKDNGTNEAWWETVARVVEGTYTMQQRWIHANRLYWNPRKAQRSAQEMYDRIFTMKFLPPGRGLWAMGSSLTEERGIYAALLNCAFASTAYLAEDPTEPFTFLMDASMLGIGVGFDTKGAGQIHVMRPFLDPWTYTIPDTREGWVESLRLLLLSYFDVNVDRVVEFDYHQIRPAGSLIRGFGGVSAGPEPLRELHEAIRRVLNAQDDHPISVTDIVDLQNLIGKCVVAGNVRRTAEIAFGAPDSIEFLDLKNYEANPHRAEFGWTSNNSVLGELGMDYATIAERIARNGEPGFLWLENSRQYGRMNGVQDDRDHLAMGTNPCGEQPLEHMECCNLVETFPANHESFADYRRTLKFAYLYAKTVTLGPTPWPKTNEVMLRNRRIGLSQSGIVQALDKFGIEEYRRWCDEGYAAVQYYDRKYSRWLAIPMSVKTTSVKPSGSVSLLAGATPGVHDPEARYYIRRMRLSIHSPLVTPLVAAGYHVEPAVGSADTTLVVEIPVHVPCRRVASEVSFWEQLERAAFLQQHWADNQVSCTVTFDPVTEGPQVEAALQYYQYRLKGISLLPRLAEGAYPQMPYEAISAERYHARMAQLRPLDFGAITGEKAEVERFCSNASCSL